jgi:hypothetical protein
MSPRLAIWGILILLALAAAAGTAIWLKRRRAPGAALSRGERLRRARRVSRLAARTSGRQRRDNLRGKGGGGDNSDTFGAGSAGDGM